MVYKLIWRMLALPGGIPGYLTILRRLQAQKVVILMYHGVTNCHPEVFNWCQLEKKEFERQVDFLVNHFDTLHLEEVVDRLHKRLPLPQRTACLTFDDGFRNVATTAFPILQKHQVPSTVFLVTSQVGTRQPAWPDRLYFSVASTTQETVKFEGAEYLLSNNNDRAAIYKTIVEKLKKMDAIEREDRLKILFEMLDALPVTSEAMVSTLDWNEVELLARTGLVKFGSHTHTHPILSRCTLNVQREELSKSRDILRERGLSYRLFAYPNGRPIDFTTDTQHLLRELGYRCGLTTIHGLCRNIDNPYSLPRVGIGADTRDRQFRLRTVGL